MERNPLSVRIYDTAIADGMPALLSSFMVGQSKFETGNYTNNACKQCNAYFSYMYDKRSDWQVPGGGIIVDNHAPVAKYDTLEKSVHEMTHWIRRRQKAKTFPEDLTTITTPLQYATLLQDTGFFQGWKKYTKQENLKIYSDGIEKGANEKDYL